MHITVPPLADRRRESRFFSGVAIVMAVVMFVGYARTGFDGLVYLAWIVMLVLQTTLVRTGFMNLHRALGIGGMILALIVVLIGTYTALVAANDPAGAPGTALSPQTFLVVPLGNLLLFGLFVILAYRRRRGKKAHKRWMLLATVNLLDAAFRRILPVAWLDNLGLLLAYWCADLFIVALAMWDAKSLGRLHAVTLWGGLAIIVLQPLRFVLADSAAWQAFAGWAMAQVSVFS